MEIKGGVERVGEPPLAVRQLNLKVEAVLLGPNKLCVDLELRAVRLLFVWWLVFTPFGVHSSLMQSPTNIVGCVAILLKSAMQEENKGS